MTRAGRHALAMAALLALAPAPATAGAAADLAPFVCGGSLELDVWRRWDAQGHAFAKEQLIEKRLAGEGDTYALYDVEIVFHNLLAMSQRCQRIDRQLQMVELVAAAYAHLVGAPARQPGRAWICRGGLVCNNTNRLINTEVKLTSTQFLAFASSLAKGVSQAGAPQAAQHLVKQTAAIAQEHLLRWSAPPARMSLRKRIAAKPEDVQDGSSALFLTDQDLWQIAIYADLAGMLAAQPQTTGGADLHGVAFLQMKEHLTLLLLLFEARTTMQAVSVPDEKGVTVADLDAGFWRLFEDNKYAGYSGRDAPAVCRNDPTKPGSVLLDTRMEAVQIAPVRDLGWDISHARRLVHFFDAIERNRADMAKVFDLPDAALPSRETIAAFAQQLHLRIWNQDRAYPLFANYFNGTNGWYRVAYANGTGRCVAGYPPYGLTDAFPTGGFVTWASIDPQLQVLGERIYELTQSSDQDAQRFVNTYYANLGAKASFTARMMAEIMFWPSLVGN
jgi:hypothetical protein